MSTTARIAESRGHLGEALEIAADAVRRADMSPGRLGHRFPVCVTQGRLLIALDRLPEARSALSAGVGVSEELGVRWALATHRVYLAYERFAAGEWDDALAELEVSITVAEEVGETYSLVYAHGLLSRISLYRNDLHRAREAADAGDRYLAGWGRGHSMSWVAWPRALIFEAEGQGGQALSTMASPVGLVRGLGAGAGTPGDRRRSGPVRAGRGRGAPGPAGGGRRGRGGRAQRPGLDDR